MSLPIILITELSWTWSLFIQTVAQYSVSEYTNANVLMISVFISASYEVPLNLAIILFLSFADNLIKCFLNVSILSGTTPSTTPTPILPYLFEVGISFYCLTFKLNIYFLIFSSIIQVEKSNIRVLWVRFWVSIVYSIREVYANRAITVPDSLKKSHMVAVFFIIIICLHRC